MPTTHTTPTYTGNSAGNIRSSASLSASATANYDVDYSAVMEGQVHVKNTPGGTIAATRGLRIDVYRRYGATPTVAESPMASYTLPSAGASTAESIDIYLGPGNYNVKITNLDASNAVTVEITGDVITDLATA